MIDLKDLRANPERYRKAAADKHIDVDIDALLRIDSEWRQAQTRQQELTAEKNRIGKEIGQLAGRLKQASGDEKAGLQQQMQQLQQRPNQIKQEESQLEAQLRDLDARRHDQAVRVPMPAADDAPIGADESENVELRRWHPGWFDPGKPFEDNRGFAPRSHMEIGEALGLFDIERGVKMAGSRSYTLTGAGMLLHQAVLRLAFDFMIHEHGFTPLSVPVLVRDRMMYGTGFFPADAENVYELKESERGGGHDLYLTGTGEVGLMGFHAEEILDAETLPRCYTTLSTCFRREAGAAGKDTAGLYRIHQFDKVEQVVLCRADADESRRWHTRMIGFVEQLLQRLELPHRLLHICTGDMGPAKVHQIDVDCWMPSRGEGGDWGETHSASELHDYQTRRLNTRYRDPDTRENVVCYSLNNTVIASPRILIPILELYQNEDGSVSVPEALRPYMHGRERIA